jgi:uncharacterized protein (DUF4415 family)
MTDKNEVDYYTYMKTHEPDVSQLHRGTDARKRRFQKTMMKGRVQIDPDILEQFRQRTPEGEDYQEAINHTLREWLSAQNVKDLVRDELHQMLQQVVGTKQGNSPDVY